MCQLNLWGKGQLYESLPRKRSLLPLCYDVLKVSVTPWGKWAQNTPISWSDQLGTSVWQGTRPSWNWDDGNALPEVAGKWSSNQRRCSNKVSKEWMSLMKKWDHFMDNFISRYLFNGHNWPNFRWTDFAPVTHPMDSSVQAIFPGICELSSCLPTVHTCEHGGQPFSCGC